MAKQIIFDSQAKDKILSGIEKLEKAVTCTLGPCGKNVIIDEYGSIHSTKDGISVAKSITLKDPYENLGANAIKEVAQKSNDKVGDGTTTSTLLAAEIYRNGLKYVNAKANATLIKNGILKAASFTINELKNMSSAISTKEQIKRVATVSANGDEKIGNMISDVMTKIGNDGTIKIENGNTSDLVSKVVEGMVIDQSYVSPYMVTDPNIMEAELDNPIVMIANKKLSNIQEMMNSLQYVSKSGRPLFIIADDYAEDILGTLIMNKMRGTINAVCIKSPSYGENRKMILDDIAVLTGGRVISDETGTKIENATLESGILGQAKKITVTSDNTVIIGGAGSRENVDSRANSLRKQIEDCNEEYKKNDLQERLAKLTSGIGVISVGATTEAERKELRDRVDDAFCASKAALRQGIVAGGGSALLKVKKNLKEFIDTLSGEEAIGANILLGSLDAPASKIFSNAGLDSSWIIHKIEEDVDTQNCGYDVVSGNYVNMIDAGIIDPTEVVINEVKNASSVASLLLMTDALVVEETKKNDNCHCNCQQPMM